MEGNYKTKKQLKASIGKPLRFREVLIFGPEYHGDGTYTLECPPGYHKFYARVTVKNGVISRVS